MTYFEPPPGDEERRPDHREDLPRRDRDAGPGPAARRVSRVAFAVSIALGLAFVGTFFMEELPLPVRSWIAQTVPGGHQLVGLAPDTDAEIARIIEQMSLTDEGARVFALAQPVVVDDLDGLCGSAGDGPLQTLGCYHGIDRIYLLRGEGPYGNAVMVTTAAHELLHAAYARMSALERESLVPLMAAEVARIDPGDRVLAQIDASVGTDESNRTNEQFAYLGSQVVLPGGFSEELERLYARWFTDREALARAAP